MITVYYGHDIKEKEADEVKTEIEGLSPTPRWKSTKAGNHIITLFQWNKGRVYR